MKETKCWIESILKKISDSEIIASFMLWFLLFIIFAVVVILCGGLSRLIHDLGAYTLPIIFSIIFVFTTKHCRKIRNFKAQLLKFVDTSRVPVEQLKRKYLKMERFALGTPALVFSFIGYLIPLFNFLLNIYLPHNYTLVEEPYEGPIIITVIYTSLPVVAFSLLVHWGFIAAVGGTVFWLCLVTLYILYSASKIPVNISILESDKLKPFASLAASMCLMLASCGLVFLTMFPGFLHWGWFELAPVLILYLGFSIFTVMVFFGSLYAIHKVMVRIKEDELSVVREKYYENYREMKQLLLSKVVDKTERKNKIDEIRSMITSLEHIRKALESARTWPYTFDMLLKVVVSSLAPLIGFVTQTLVIKILAFLGL